MENKTQQSKLKRRDPRIQSIFSRCLLTRNISLPIIAIGKNLKETLEENLKMNFEGKCVVEGYIKKGSTKIITHSSGLIVRGNTISFEVVFECDICFPVEGMLINCVVKNITKAGITAESASEVPSPIMVFVAKDHHFNSSYFAEIKEGDKINIRVIGQRFELNNTCIYIIAELVKPRFEKDFNKQKETKPKLVIEEE